MLDVSVEGQQHAALEAHLQTALSELLQLHHHLTVARGLLALADAARHLYPLSVLHHAPELLTATATATATSSSTSSSFDALLFVCPAAFPYCGQQSDRRMEVLRLHMIAEDLYALAAAGDECNRAPTLHKALEHCIAAQQLVPDNAMINLRTASILSKLGRRNEAVQMLKQQHDRTPHVGKVSICFDFGLALIFRFRSFGKLECNCITNSITRKLSAQFMVASSRPEFTKLDLDRRSTCLLVAACCMSLERRALEHLRQRSLVKTCCSWSCRKYPSGTYFEWRKFALFGPCMHRLPSYGEH